MICRAQFFLAALLVTTSPAVAETITALRTIPGNAQITAADITTVAANLPGGLKDPSLVIGAEAKYIIYAGHPIRAADIGPPALITRNQNVTLIFVSGAVYITAEGRSLGRAAIGESIRVMNLASRQIVTGHVTAEGQVLVQSTTNRGVLP